LASDLTFGLRFAWFLALPAAVGLWLLARPLAALLFERGAFTAADTQRTATLIACYALGTWAYCALPVLMRGYFALGNRGTPARVGLAAVALNLVLNLTLVWSLAEAGLASATATAAVAQVVLLCSGLGRLDCNLDWASVRVTLAKTTAATLVMIVVVGLLLHWMPAGGTKLEQLVRICVAMAGGGASFLVAAVLLRAEELAMLTGRAGTLGR
jgi:putative peptidoglycan lipid II flippase